MGVLEFASEISKSVLSWPVAVVVVALIFRTRINELIRRMKRLEGFGANVDFTEELETARSEARQASTDAKIQASGDEGNSILSESFNDPVGAIVKAWEKLQRSVESLYGVHGKVTSQRSTTALIQELRAKDLVNQSFVDSVNKLRKTRNAVVHDIFSPSSEDARLFASTARELTIFCETVVKQEKFKSNR